MERTQNENDLYWRTYDVPKQKLLNQTGRIFLYGMGYFFTTLESIVKKHSILRIRFGTPAFVSMSSSKSQFYGRDMSSKPTFNVPNRNLRPIQTNIYNIAKIPLGNFKMVLLEAISLSRL